MINMMGTAGHRRNKCLAIAIAILADRKRGVEQIEQWLPVKRLTDKAIIFTGTRNANGNSRLYYFCNSKYVN